MKLPRGYKVVSETVEGGELVMKIKVSRWRAALLTLRVLRHGFKYRPR